MPYIAEELRRLADRVARLRVTPAQEPPADEPQAIAQALQHLAQRVAMVSILFEDEHLPRD